MQLRGATAGAGKLRLELRGDKAGTHGWPYVLESPQSQSVVSGRGSSSSGSGSSSRSSRSGSVSPTPLTQSERLHEIVGSTSEEETASRDRPDRPVRAARPSSAFVCPRNRLRRSVAPSAPCRLPRSRQSCNPSSGSTTRPLAAHPNAHSRHDIPWRRMWARPVRPACRFRHHRSDVRIWQVMSSHVRGSEHNGLYLGSRETRFAIVRSVDAILPLKFQHFTFIQTGGFNRSSAALGPMGSCRSSRASRRLHSSN